MVKLLRKSSIGWLLGFLATSFGAAGLGASWTARSVDGWYRTLRKPRLNPPNSLFAPVWTVLYVQMAVSAWLIRRAVVRRPEVASEARTALLAWGAQLALNVAWTGVFFGKQRIGGGLAVIVTLWMAIATTAALDWRISRGASLLLAPYLAWTSFATYLNLRLFQLNHR